MYKRLFALLSLGLVLAVALVPAGCVKPRPSPTVVPTKMGIAPTRLPTVLVPSATPTRVEVASSTEATPTRTAEPTAAATAQATVPVATATQAPTPEPTTAPGTGGEEITYEVRWGDTLARIARQFGTTVEAIMERNPSITDPNRVNAGSVLVIPSGGGQPPSGEPTAAPGGTEPRYYIVQRGDTLYSIARRYGTTVDVILQANPSITNRNYIQAGRRIVIPGGSGGTSSGITHVVRAGDTLTALARRYNTTVWAIVVRNNLSNANLIYVGQVLIIP